MSLAHQLGAKQLITSKNAWTPHPLETYGTYVPRKLSVCPSSVTPFSLTYFMIAMIFYIFFLSYCLTLFVTLVVCFFLFVFVFYVIVSLLTSECCPFFVSNFPCYILLILFLLFIFSF